MTAKSSRWRAFFRSAAITLFITAIYAYEVKLVTIISERDPASINTLPYYFVMIGSMLAINVISDYVSLPVARRWLAMAGNRPVFALISSQFIFALVFIIGFLLRVTLAVALLLLFSSYYRFYGTPRRMVVDAWNLLLYDRDSVVSLLIPSIIVYMWLPLFGLSILLVRVGERLFPAVRTVQSALKDGDKHPLNAVGYVAAVLVFVAILLWRHLRGDPVVEHALDYGTGLVLALL
jgi:hypothetical protein